MADIDTDNSSATQRQFGGGNPVVLFIRSSMEPIRKEARSAFNARVKELMRNARAAKGWSQAKAAKHCGLSKADYEKFEGDEGRRIPADSIEDICDGLDIDLELFMRGPARRAG